MLELVSAAAAVVEKYTECNLSQAYQLPVRGKPLLGSQCLLQVVAHRDA